MYKDHVYESMAAVDDLIADAKLLLKNAKKAKKTLSMIDCVEDYNIQEPELEHLLSDKWYKYIILESDGV